MGCGTTAGKSAQNMDPGQCGTGTMTPGDVSALRSTFRSSGITLEDDGRCTSPPSLAELSNTRVTGGAEQTAINAREGEVICTIEPDSIGRKIDRAHYPGEDQTYLSVLNVSC